MLPGSYRSRFGRVRSSSALRLVPAFRSWPAHRGHASRLWYSFWPPLLISQFLIRSWRRTGLRNGFRKAKFGNMSMTAAHRRPGKQLTFPARG